jgi:hypothetical protein
MASWSRSGTGAQGALAPDAPLSPLPVLLSHSSGLASYLLSCIHSLAACSESLMFDAHHAFGRRIVQDKKPCFGLAKGSWSGDKKTQSIFAWDFLSVYACVRRFAQNLPRHCCPCEQRALYCSEMTSGRTCVRSRFKFWMSISRIRPRLRELYTDANTPFSAVMV